MKRAATALVLSGILLACSGASLAGAAGPGFVSGGLGPKSTKTCPQAVGPHIHRFLVRKLHGKRLGTARAIARRHGCTVRVVRKNKKWLAVTDDFRYDRVNVAIKGRKRWVTRVYGVQ